MDETGDEMDKEASLSFKRAKDAVCNFASIQDIL